MKKLLLHAHGHAKRHYEKHYRTHYKERAHLVFLLDAILVTTALGLLALGSYFSWFYHPLRDDFRLSVATVGETVGGQEGEISVFVENVGKETLKDARLTVYLPDTFLAADGMVGSREIEIGLLPAGTSARYGFRGMPLGAPRAAKVVAHFEAYGLDGRYDERLVAGDLKWERSLIEARFDTPASIAKGQRFPIGIVIKNGSPLTFGYVRVAPTWPDGFRPSTSSPPLSKGAIVVGELSPGEEVRINVVGTYTGDADAPVFSADVLWIDGDRTLSIAGAESTLKNFETGLWISAAFSQYFLKTISADRVDFMLTYRNEGKYVLKDARFSMITDARVVDRVSWTAKDTIGEIPPGASGQLSGTIYLKTRLSEFVTTPSLALMPEVAVSIPEAGITDAVIRGEGQTAKVVGQAYLAATARYHTDEGDQIGRGPWPPKVGASTRYWILLKAESGASPLSGVSVNFALPKNVRWTGRASLAEGQTLEPCSEICPTNGLVWSVGGLPAHAGILSPSASLAFEVAFTPTTDQIGQMPPVILDATLRGYDAWADSSVLTPIGSPGFPSNLLPQGGALKVRP